MVLRNKFMLNRGVILQIILKLIMFLILMKYLLIIRRRLVEIMLIFYRDVDVRVDRIWNNLLLLKIILVILINLFWYLIVRFMKIRVLQWYLLYVGFVLRFALNYYITIIGLFLFF